jgi:hypothetical protein
VCVQIVLTVADLVAQNFENLLSKCYIAQICVAGNYAQKWATKLYVCQFIICVGLAVQTGVLKESRTHMISGFCCIV